MKSCLLLACIWEYKISKYLFTLIENQGQTKRTISTKQHGELMTLMEVHIGAWMQVYFQKHGWPSDSYSTQKLTCWLKMTHKKFIPEQHAGSSIKNLLHLAVIHCLHHLLTLLSFMSAWTSQVPSQCYVLWIRWVSFSSTTGSVFISSLFGHVCWSLEEIDLWLYSSIYDWVLDHSASATLILFL